MKKVYERPEVEYINFYSEEDITNEWEGSIQEGTTSLPYNSWT
jgi:hypothetical protein